MIEDQTAPVTRDRHEWYWSAKGGSICRQCGLKIEGRPEVAHEGPCVWVPETTELRLILSMAPSFQGGHSKTGREVADYLGIPFPLTTTNLEKKAKAHAFDPYDLWPWLKQIRGA